MANCDRPLRGLLRLGAFTYMNAVGAGLDAGRVLRGRRAAA
jgi:hypothetical protein